MFCWVVCFFWMHRISQRQASVLSELRSIAKGIEATSRAGHELIKEVHPTVAKIQEAVEDVATAVEKK